MLETFRRSPSVLARPPKSGERVRISYTKRGPWYEGEVVEALGQVVKVRLDQAGVAYYVRERKRWVDQQLNKVFVAAPADPIANGAGFTFREKGGKTYRWSRAELDDTLLEGEAWDSSAMRKRIDALAPGKSITVAGETLTRDGGDCCSSCAGGGECTGKSHRPDRARAQREKKGARTSTSGRRKLTRKELSEIARAQHQLARVRRVR